MSRNTDTTNKQALAWHTRLHDSESDGRMSERILAEYYVTSDLDTPVLGLKDIRQFREMMEMHPLPLFSVQEMPVPIPEGAPNVLTDWADVHQDAELRLGIPRIVERPIPDGDGPLRSMDFEIPADFDIIPSSQFGRTLRLQHGRVTCGSSVGRAIDQNDGTVVKMVLLVVKPGSAEARTITRRHGRLLDEEGRSHDAIELAPLSTYQILSFDGILQVRQCTMEPCTMEFTRPEKGMA